MADVNNAPAGNPPAGNPPAGNPPAGNPPAGNPPAAAPAPAPKDGEPPAKDGVWPADWRETYAKGDEKVLKRLQRYASPEAAMDALFTAQAQLSKGAGKTALPDNATPEQLAAWREANNIPETPEGYTLQLSDGLIVGQADKPFVDDFLKTAHGKNLDQSTVSLAVDWFLNKQQEAVAQQTEADNNTRVKTHEALREEYGPGYKTEVKIALEALSGMPAELQTSLMTGRLADGTMIGDHPGVIRWLNSIQRQINPVGTVVPGSGAQAVQAMETELTNLRKLMGDKNSDYWKGPKAAGNQARYRELVTAQQRYKAQG